jgi:ubiquinone/menaquinone biosynthesis C-methylase UbiE
MANESGTIIKGYSTEKSKRFYSKIGLWKEEEKLIKKYFKSKSKILDIGCGGGRTTIPISKMGYDVTAIDIVPEFIKIAKQNSKKNKVTSKIEIGDVTKLKYRSSLFDNVLFSYNGIEHVSPDEIEKAIKEIIRVLKKEGYFIFTVHSILNPGKNCAYWLIWGKEFLRFYLKKLFGIKQRERYFGDTYWKDYGEDIYAHFDTPNYYKKILKKVGFKKIQILPQSKVIGDQKGSFFDKFSDGNIFFICQK